MKKIISVGLVLLMAISFMALPVSATESPEVDDVISNVVVVDKNNNKADVNLNRTDVKDDDLKPQGNDEKVIGYYNVSYKGTPKFPLTFTLKVAGIKKTSRVYVLAKDNDGNVKRIEAVVLGNEKIKFTFDKAYEVLSVITDKKTSTQVGTSDKTGDFATPIIAICMLASLAVVYTAKKQKEN